MKRFGRMLATLLVVSTAAIAPASAQSFERLDGNWGLQLSKDGASFSHCVVLQSSGSGEALMIYLGRERIIAINVVSTDWNLDENGNYDLTLSTDKGWQETFSAHAFSSNILQLLVTSSILTALQEAGTLHIDGEGKQFEYTLDGFRQAYIALNNCVLTALEEERVSLQAPQGAALDPATGSSFGPTPLSWDLLMIMLREMQLDEMERVEDPRSTDLNWAEFTWRTGPVYGGYIDVPVDAHDSVDLLGSRIIEALTSTCFDRSIIYREKSEELTRAQIKSVWWACGERNAEIYHYATLVLIPEDSLLMMFVHRSSFADRALADEADLRANAAMRRMFND